MKLLHRHMRGCIGLLLLVGLAIPSTAIADDPPEPDRAAIEILGKEIIARLDAVDEARAARAVAEEAAQGAKAALGEAERTRIIAEISIKEYLEGSYPQDVQTVLGEIKLAESELARATDLLGWTEKQREKKMLSDDQVLAAKMSRQKFEISLMNARKKMEVLEKYSKIKTTTKLESDARKAKAREALAQQSWQSARTALERADRQLADNSVTDRETQAITSLDEALDLFDDGKTEAARARLDAAKMLWREAQESRAKTRYIRVKDRVRAEANRLRAGK